MTPIIFRGDYLTFLPINIKLMRPDELLYCLDKAAQGREEIAELYKQQGQATLSCLDSPLCQDSCRL